MSIKELIDLIDAVHRYDLQRSGWFDKKSVEELERCFNGVGPDWMPMEVRGALSCYLEFFMPAVLIHDADFTWMDKTDENFELANDRLLRNCNLLVKAKIPWWRFATRRRRYNQAIIMHWACDTFGLQGFMH